ncbi:hypothetical protein ACF3NS_07970 [Arsenicicoccus cauae]|uniref:hypothetical protein n=1 Tax=Arsenicicoccus cauae TaxID=2663847 RepID=UPI00370DDE4F
MTRRPDGSPQPSLRLVRDDDELVQRIADRDQLPEHDDPVLDMLQGWAADIDEDLPADLVDDLPRPLPSRRTVLVTRAGVAAGVAAVVLSGVTVAAAASEGGLVGFVSKVERGVEKGVAAPRPADAAVLATADVTSQGPDGRSVRTALALASQRLGAGDRDGAAAVLSLVEDQLRRDPSLLDDADQALLATVRQDLTATDSRGDHLVLADPPSPASTSAARPGIRSPGRPDGAPAAAGPVTSRPSTRPSTSPTGPAPSGTPATGAPTSPASPTQAPTSPRPTTHPTQPTPTRPTSPTTTPTSPTSPTSIPSTPTTSPTLTVRPTSTPTPSATATGTARVGSVPATSVRARTSGTSQRRTSGEQRSQIATRESRTSRGGGSGGEQR